MVISCRPAGLSSALLMHCRSSETSPAATVNAPCLFWAMPSRAISRSQLPILVEYVVHLPHLAMLLKPRTYDVGRRLPTHNDAWLLMHELYPAGLRQWQDSSQQGQWTHLACGIRCCSCSGSGACWWRSSPQNAPTATLSHACSRLAFSRCDQYWIGAQPRHTDPAAMHLLVIAGVQ